MADAKLNPKRPPHPIEDEDQETLAAIDKGIRDAEAGRLTPITEVEKMLPRWISKSSSPTKR